jgi:hypothetical protein
MIDRLQQVGYDDTGILDLAIAVADANSSSFHHSDTRPAGVQSKPGSLCPDSLFCEVRK